MKKLLFFYIILFINSCRPAEPIAAIPKALFNIYNENCKAPCNVTFYNLTRSGVDTKYLWEFGDGDTSTAFNPNHSYFEGGTYNVRLTASNNNGSTLFEKFIKIEKNIPLSLVSTCRVESVKLTKITHNKPDNSRWDDVMTVDSLADFFWFVVDKDNREITRDNGQGEGFNLSQKNLPFIKTRLVRAAAMRNLSEFYKLYIIDEDGGPFDIMAELRFRPVDYFPQQPEGATGITVYQSTFTIEKNGIAYEVNLNWQ
jgi:PKD repeat protein